MKVENVKGSSEVSPNPPSPYTSWLNYWEVEVEYFLRPNTYYYCPACRYEFLKENLNGCHVRKVNDLLDRRWYIVPLCDSCNQRDGILDIGNVSLVPVPSNL